MRIEFLLGPAGSGKTFQCLQRARRALEQSPDGLPLLFLAPKQATYQLERQLLASPSLSGSTRLHILSFERLCRWIFKQARQPEPELLSEQGRIMVLRALLARHEAELKVFRASARAGGFATLLSRLLREFQQSRIDAARLRELAKKTADKNRLRDKLNDLALLLEAYQGWLKSEELEDADRLIEMAADLLERDRVPVVPRVQLRRFSMVQGDLFDSGLGARMPTSARTPGMSFIRADVGIRAPIQFEQIWLDGFARLTTQEQRLLKALAARSERTTLAFCLDAGVSESAWHSHWFAVEQGLGEVRAELETIEGAEIVVTGLQRCVTVESAVVADALPAHSKMRFAEPELQHLEACWAEPKPYQAERPLTAVRLVECMHPEGEATFAAREILRYVRQGGRFRDTAVIVRQLDLYHDVLRRVFLRYEIPFFLDRRQPIAHHPLAELIRGALRTLAFNWQHGDWFCALKSGLLPATQDEIDHLENEALARGWEGAIWLKPLVSRNEKSPTEQFETLRKRLVSPFVALAQQLGATPTGQQLAGALLDFWKKLEVDRQLEAWSTESVGQGPMHLTVWEQLQQWAQDLALAFRHETQTLKQWVPIIESGLENLSVGVIPPVLDQVLLGAVDRSRNPDLQRVFVLGLNEGIFPAPVAAPPILSDLDRDVLERDCRAPIGASSRLQIGQERFFGYIACSRARERLVLTYAARDLQGAQLNPSSLVTHIQRLFPQLKNTEHFDLTPIWQTAEHHCEIVAPLLKARARTAADRGDLITALSNLPKVAPILARLEAANPSAPVLSPHLARALYGPVHPTSVSALEKFGGCPFQFFIDSGLKAEERKKFQLDPRQAGTFQHEVLEEFHHLLKKRNQTWHSVPAKEAREHVGQIADQLIETFNEGMLKATHENRFIARQKKERLQRFVEVLVGWMQSQYAFEPEAVELAFGLDGSENPLPAWKIEAFEGYSLALRGCIDRVDVFRPDGEGTAWCVVMDYKSSGKNIDELLMTHGIQLQLPGYLAALRGIEGVPQRLGAKALRLAGIFFVNLSGEYSSVPNRNLIVADKSSVHKAAFKHVGRFDEEALDFLDKRNAVEGDQFNYKRRADGGFHSNIKGPLPYEKFQKLLEETEAQMREFGRKIYEGVIEIAPYKKGAERACKHCEHSAICRIDTWTHDFGPRNLKKIVEEEDDEP